MSDMKLLVFFISQSVGDAGPMKRSASTVAPRQLEEPALKQHTAEKPCQGRTHHHHSHHRCHHCRDREKRQRSLDTPVGAQPPGSAGQSAPEQKLNKRQAASVSSLILFSDTGPQTGFSDQMNYSQAPSHSQLGLQPFFFPKVQQESQQSRRQLPENEVITVGAPMRGSTITPPQTNSATTPATATAAGSTAAPNLPVLAVLSPPLRHRKPATSRWGLQQHTSLYTFI